MIQKKKKNYSKIKGECEHSLSYRSTMRTLKTTSDFYIRECRVCGFKESLPRYQGSTQNLLLRNSFRVRYPADYNLKDLIQPYQGGKASKEFMRAYPDKAGDYFTQKELNQAGFDKIKSKKK